ncbi:MAG: hypothetical protein MRY63_07965 [Neomegalonema sp.]|nr:hypothetical protein [Neomegalonema sp.]
MRLWPTLRAQYAEVLDKLESAESLAAVTPAQIEAVKPAAEQMKQAVESEAGRALIEPDTAEVIESEAEGELGPSDDPDSFWRRKVVVLRKIAEAMGKTLEDGLEAAEAIKDEVKKIKAGDVSTAYTLFQMIREIIKALL